MTPRQDQALGRGLWLLAFVLILFVPRPGAAQDPSAPPIDDLIVALQDKYDSVRDFSADFEHSYAGGLLRARLVEHGTVVVKKPGMMRWRYTAPEEKLFVSDGTTMYSYIPIDRQVIVGEIPPEDRASTPVLFLSGKGRLVRDFDAAYGEVLDPMPNTWVIRLTPKTPELDYEWLTLVVDRTSLRIRQLLTTDFQQGVSTFTFTNLEENTEPADDLFHFEIPGGTEVIRADDLGP